MDIFRKSTPFSVWDHSLQLDKFDRAILSALQKNGRITLAELSHLVGLSKTPCQLRIKKLEQQGVLKGYTALIDHAMLGLDHVAFVQVTLTCTNTASLQAFNDAVGQISAIEQCHMTAAGFDYLLKVRTTDMNQYRKVLGEQISTLPFVHHTSTFVVMETVKEPGN